MQCIAFGGDRQVLLFLYAQCLLQERRRADGLDLGRRVDGEVDLMVDKLQGWPGGEQPEDAGI